MRSVIVLIAATISVAACGCDGGPSIAPVSGKVTMAGKPLGNVQVEFWPEAGAPRSTGMTNDQGQFTLTTDGTNKPGAVVGTHKVVVYDLSVYASVGIRPREDTNIRDKPARFPHAYNDPHHTPLTAKVTTGANDIALEVKAK